MTTTGEFKYVEGWFSVFVGKTGLVERCGPYNTEEQAKLEREKETGNLNEIAQAKT